MKLKSLFLATLAAMAMASCSNDNDPIDNGGEEKDAVFNFSIAMPKAATTKATTHPGDSTESAVSSITLTLKYTNSNIPDFSKTYSDINAAFTKTNDGDKYIYTLKSAELVAPGDATAYVYVNGDEMTELETKTGFLTTYATEKNFYMTGSENITILENKVDNRVNVKVDRVAVKLEEITDTDTLTNGRQSYFMARNKTQTDNVVELYLELQNYTFSNLNKKSNALKGTIFQPDTASIKTYFNYFVEDKNEDRWDDAFKETKEFAEPITYCFENSTSPAKTQIWYKAKVSAKFSNDGTVEELDTFYVYNKVLYKSFKELNAAFNGILDKEPLNLSGKSTNEEMATKVGVKKYTAGYCYYFHDISTDGSILRNNWYKLKVTGITDLGLPEIDPKDPKTPTMLIFDVTVLPWTVNENSFVLGGEPETPQQ